MDGRIKGRVVRGLRAASGASRRLRTGTIALQIPHFRRLLPEFDQFFDAAVHMGTLNVAIPHHDIRVDRPSYHLLDVAWEYGMVENFYLSPCILSYAGRHYRGLIYLPDPATKPAGLPVGHVLEVLTTVVPFIRYGAKVVLTFDKAAVQLARTPPRSHGRGRTIRGRRPTNRRTPGRVALRSSS